jgi:hypothetical protein
MPPCSEADWERLTASQHATMSKLAAASQWIVIYPWMVHSVVLIVLFIMCRLLQWLDPSWMQSALDGAKFLLLFPLLHFCWVTFYNPSSVFKLQLQVCIYIYI